MSLKRIAIARRLSRPPQRLRIEAVTPRVSRAKKDLKRVTAKPYGTPRVLTQNIVTMLEKPGFMPGMGTIGGKSDSRYEIVIASAQKSPIRATVVALVFFRISHLCFVAVIYVVRFIGEGERSGGDPPRQHEVPLNLKLLSTLFVSATKERGNGATHHQKRSFWSPSLFGKAEQG